ncbi:MAG TPA: glycosyltransferase family 87 protein [Solirubrobacterales bacterium]|nr:glycosyltransferase family 87 protein [Solirubrobacterales bacterium]
MHTLLGDRRHWLWLAVWIATRAFIVAEVGFWGTGHPKLEDVNNYDTWSHVLTSEGAFPGGDAWQYPPAAGLLMLIPRILPGTYGEAFVGLMLVVDLVGLVLLARLGRRAGNDTGVWVWLLAMPLLGTFAVLRFDLVPTVIAIAALVVVHRRPQWFGALAGLGAVVKLWPVLVLFGEWDRQRLLRSIAAAVAVVAVVFAASAIAFGDPAGFVSHGGDRGLQEEAVATIPWQLEQIVSGDPYPREIRFGAWEVASPTADTVATVLGWLTLVALTAAAAWWWRWRQRIGEGWDWLANAAVSRDFVFTIVLLVVVTSRVLSTQYMVWLLGLAAVVLSAGTARLARPAWIVVGATALSTATFKSPELTLIRDAALLAATIDAVVAMVGMLRRPAQMPLGSVQRSIRAKPGSIT